MNEFVKRQKLDSNNGEFCGSLDSSNESRKLVRASKTVDFTLPAVKRKILAPRRASFNHSESSDDQQYSQISSGYGSSLYSSNSSSNPQLTPKKRKSNSHESDENFYNSFSFISPVKLRSAKENCAKRILKEKCSSENVIRCSTPVLNNNKKKIWGRFRSHHPENVKNPLASFKLTEGITKSIDEGSFDELSSFDITNNSSINITNDEHRALISGSIRTSSEHQESHFTPIKVKEEIKPTPSINNKKFNYCGRDKIDIIGKLNDQYPIILNDILKNLDFKDILSLSHVSHNYRNIARLNKKFETERLNYLEAFKKNEENLYPGNRSVSTKLTETSQFTISEKKNLSRLGAYNKNIINQSTKLQVSPPVSPSKRRFHENQKVARSFSGKLTKCPRCRRPAKIQVTKIRKSPRKKRNLMKISYKSPGRVQKKSSTSTFLTHSSFLADSVYGDSLYSTTTTFLGINSSPESSSSSHGSPTRHSSDDSSGNESVFDSISHEYAECTGRTCNFKFCPRCECKSHPREECKEYSPHSPTHKNSEKASVACTSQSIKRLKRLIK